MGLLNSLIGDLVGGSAAATSSPFGAVLGSILSGQGYSAGSTPGGFSGGLGGLVRQFQDAGLGHIAESWVGSGGNQPVTPHQLGTVFGQNRVNDMAGQAGMAPEDFLSQLSQHLPAAVDAATPNGRLPDEGSVSV